MDGWSANLTLGLLPACPSSGLQDLAVWRAEEKKREQETPLSLSWLSFFDLPHLYAIHRPEPQRVHCGLINGLPNRPRRTLCTARWCPSSVVLSDEVAVLSSPS